MSLLIALLLFSDAALQHRPAPVVANVHIGDRGPFRFLVDTGSETTLVDGRIATELGLRPSYRVEVVTQHGTQAMAAAKSTVQVEGTTIPDVELVWGDLAGLRSLDRRIKGVLGMNVLRGVAFALTPANGRLELRPKRPAGTAMPYRHIEGRPALEATMGGEKLTLLLDSGSTHLVLFRTPAAMAKVRPAQAAFTTVEGARNVIPTCWSAEMRFGDSIRVGTKPAAYIPRPGSAADGLLPAALFGSVYVDPVLGEVVLTAK